MSTGAKRVAGRASASRGRRGVVFWLGLTLAVGVTLIAGLGAAFLWWAHSPLTLKHSVVELNVERGRSGVAVAQDWVAAGVQTPIWALQAWFRWSGKARQIRAGSYAVEPGVTPSSLLDKMVRGEEALESVTFIEGWTFAQMRSALKASPGLRLTTTGLSDGEVMEMLGSAGLPAEGWFFPDTYRYARGASDRAVLQQAHSAMKNQLERAWEQRHAGLPLKRPADALILASIIEKETGRQADRAQIAGVFVNRLRLGMPLQTDPTVIYGMGASFDGNLRRRDLQADTPFNTYTRKGLPPHAIAMPGAQSIRAAVQPQKTEALYFVARGDGSSHFSATLQEHNQAVWRYQKMAAGRP